MSWRDTITATGKKKSSWRDTISTSEQGPGGLEKFETASRSALEGATFGLSEPAISGVNALIGAGIESAMDENVDFNPETIRRVYAEDVARRKGLEAELPVISTAAEIGGAVAPALLSGGASLLTAPTRLAAKTGSAITGKLGGGLLARGAGAAAEGALAAGAQEAIKSAAQVPTGFKESSDIGSAVGTGALLGGALPIAAGLPKKIFSMATSVPEEAISRYAQRARQGLPIRDATRDEVQAIVEKSQNVIKEISKEKRDEFVNQSIKAVKNLKDSLIKESDAAYDILDKAKGKINKQNLISTFKKTADSIEPISDAELAAKTKLESWIKRIESNYEGDLSFPQLKKVVQSIDKDTAAAYTGQAGEFGTDVGNALKGVRKDIDSFLKDSVPEYKVQMAKVADKSQKLAVASEAFGSPEDAARTLDKLSGVKENRLKAQAFDALKSVEEQEALSGLAKQFDEVNRVANLTNTENFTKTLIANQRDVKKNQEYLKVLSQYSDDDLQQIVSDAQLLDRFAKDATRGSRNVNLWAMIGGAVGTPGGIAGVGGGLAGGAIIGRAMDQYGGKVARKIIDGMARIEGIPTVRKVNEVFSDLPAEVRGRLRADLIRVNQMSREDGPVKVDAETAISLKKDIMESGLSNTEKARAMSLLQTRGVVDSGLIRNLTLTE